MGEKKPKSEKKEDVKAPETTTANTGHTEAKDTKTTKDKHPNKGPAAPFNSPLKEHYRTVAVPELMKKFNYKNQMQVPKVMKVVVNMGVGEGTRNRDLFTLHSDELMAITGQKPVITKAKHAISNFKIRKGMAVGIKVTLRGRVMENFLYKLFNIVLPKVRDFRGLNPNSFDGKGNYSFGLSEQVIFPEIKVEKVKRIQGMDIIIVTSARNNEEAKALLSSLGLPFKKA
jgi:large subunit ribosomal protein L5